MKGDSWNESETYEDPVTGRKVRRLTRWGLYNQTPTYHTNIGFTADGEYLVLASGRGGGSMILKAQVATGELTELTSVEGIGGRGSLHRGNGSGVGDGRGITGGALCLAPQSRWCVYHVGRSLRAVHLDTLKERTLIEDCGEEWIFGTPSVSPDEEQVVITLCSAHPQVLAGERVSSAYISYASVKEFPRLCVVEVPLAGGKVKELYQEAGCNSAHSPHCPADGDLILLDRDMPPDLWAGSNGETPRLWLLDRRTGGVQALKQQYPAQFQVHAAWTFDGQLVLYHGPLSEGGYYLGATSREGETICEFILPQATHYGHITADPKRSALILDGNISSDLLTWFYYDSRQRRVEIIARHGTEWYSLPGQFSHPHPLADPTGRWISFNAAHRGRSDVYVVAV